MGQLPIKLDDHLAEGGHSLALRTLQSNGLTFTKAAYWLDFNWTKAIRHQHIKQWAWALQIRPDWLSYRVPMTCQEDGVSITHFMGRRWQGGHRIRTHRPQVCVRCVHQLGYCHAAWDLQLACVCPLHSCLLIERCNKCRKALEWNRPSVDVCACLQPLKRADNEQEISPLVLRWSSWLESRLLYHDREDEALLVGMPKAVTPNGLFGVFMALGIKERAHQTPSPTLWTRVLSTGATYEHLRRGLSRLNEGLQTQDWQKLAPITHEQTLLAIANDHLEPVDRDFAELLLESIFPKEETKRKGLRRKGQLPLEFGGSE